MRNVEIQALLNALADDGLIAAGDCDALVRAWDASAIPYEDACAWVAVGVFEPKHAKVLIGSGWTADAFAVCPNPRLVGASFARGETTVRELENVLAAFRMAQHALVDGADTFVRGRTVESRSPTASQLDLGDRPVLVVDDDEDSRGGMAEVLRIAGHTVVELANGRDALHYLLDTRQPQPSVIILDLVMPVMSGWELLSVVKSYYRLSTIPLVIISGAEAPDLAIRMHSSDRALKKPFDPPQLLALVDEYVRGSGPIKSAG